MNWYTAHAIMYVRFKDGVQDKYPFWENIFLIEADSDEEAFSKAEQRAFGKVLISTHKYSTCPITPSSR